MPMQVLAVRISLETTPNPEFPTTPNHHNTTRTPVNATVKTKRPVTRLKRIRDADIQVLVLVVIIVVVVIVISNSIAVILVEFRGG